MPTRTLIERPTDLTADWLTATLGGPPVTGFEVERIGTGQMSECYRVRLRYGTETAATGPASVILKVAAADPSSRQTGLSMGLYEREVRFYADVAPGLGDGVAACHHAAYDPETGAFDLLLEDAHPAVPGDEIRGATVDQAMAALRTLGRVHGPAMRDAALADADWLTRESPVDQALIGALYAGFLDRYHDRIAPEHREVCDRYVASFDAFMAEQETAPRGLVHGDYRLDNLLFDAEDVTVVDWQTVTSGPALTDVAYFLGCALPTDARREHYDALLAAYHEALGPGNGLTADDVREQVRRQSFFGVLMAIVSSMLVERTDRGDDMFTTILARHCDHVLDTGALELLPAPTVPEPLQANAADEGAHQPTDEPSWSESWYFDFVDAGQGIGGWIRLGLLPNQGRSWINALVCGPDMPTVAVLDFDAPLPADHAAVRSAAAELRLDAVAPLQEYRVSLTGRGEAHDDPAALLRGEPGRPVDLAMDITWTTAGTPYQYRLSSRYEIPCTATGTVTIDGTEHRIAGVPAQRDHSWAARDWWSMDWVWSALHLDDGAHVHGLDLRIPGAPRLAAGYLQGGGAPMVEFDRVVAEETFAGDLPVTTTLRCDPGGFVARADVRGHAPVRLVAPDGRVSLFPRAWATVTTTDGRSGVGWLEWNRNQA